MGIIQAENVKLYDLNELKRILHLSKVTIRGYIKQGKLNARKLGRNWYVDGESLQRFLQGKQGATTTSH